MRTFTAALGVQCGYCHVFEGAGNPANDLAADTKTPKLVARVMMQMTSEINQKLAANIKKPADQLTAVGCMMCHRGRGDSAGHSQPPGAAGLTVRARVDRDARRRCRRRRGRPSRRRRYTVCVCHSSSDA